MPLDEGLLTRVLARPAQDTPESAIDDLMHQAQSASYQLAAQRAAVLIEAGCQDVRAFVVYALGLFAERGPSTIPDSFDSIAALLSAQAPSLTSSSPALRIVDTCLRFGFRMLKAQLDFDERQNDAARRVWVQYLTPESPTAVARACAELRKSLHALVEAPLCEDELGAVIARLDAYCARNQPEPSSDRASTERRAADTDTEHAPPPESRPTPAIERETDAELSFARRASDAHADAGSLTIAPALQHFMRKLEAFELLVASGSLGKAAIVAEDIRNVVAAFDPMIYLPNLLAPHFRLLTNHVEQLSPYWEQGPTAGRHALEQLYRVDLDAFVES